MQQCQAQAIDQHRNVQGVIYDVGRQSATSSEVCDENSMSIEDRDLANEKQCSRVRSTTASLQNYLSQISIVAIIVTMTKLVEKTAALVRVDRTVVEPLLP